VNSVVGVSDFYLGRFEKRVSPEVLFERLRRRETAYWGGRFGVRSAKGRFYALTAAITPGTPTRVMVRLIL
jgi:hypothetical protein